MRPRKCSNRVDWVFGLAPNAALCRHVAALQKSTAAPFKAAPGRGKVRRFGQFHDAAQSWSRVERIIARVEAGLEGTDTRFIVTTQIALMTGAAISSTTAGTGAGGSGLAELILDMAAETGIELPPLSPAQKAEIEAEIGFVTGDGNPLDAWGSGTFAANLPLALKLFDASPAHDVIAFVRDNFDNQPFDAPETARRYIDMFAEAARRSAKPHYLLTTRPGVMNRALVGVLREHGVAAVGGFREGLMAIDRLARNAK